MGPGWGGRVTLRLPPGALCAALYWCQDVQPRLSGSAWGGARGHGRALGVGGPRGVAPWSRKPCKCSRGIRAHVQLPQQHACPLPVPGTPRSGGCHPLASLGTVTEWHGVRGTLLTGLPSPVCMVSRPWPQLSVDISPAALGAGLGRTLPSARSHLAPGACARTVEIPVHTGELRLRVAWLGGQQINPEVKFPSLLCWPADNVVY